MPDTRRAACLSPFEQELILDKLAAKLLQVGAYLAVALPMVCLLGLIGGIDPRSIAYAYGGTVSTAFFLASVSLFVSVYSRGPRARSCSSI